MTMECIENEIVSVYEKLRTAFECDPMLGLIFWVAVLVLTLLSGVIIVRYKNAEARKDSAINSILAKIAMEKMDPAERLEFYETSAKLTLDLSADDVELMPERARLPFLAFSFAHQNYPPPLDGETWRRSFLDIDNADEQIAFAIAYFKDQHGIAVSI